MNKGTLKVNAVASNSNLFSWNKFDAQLCPLASGTHSPNMGFEDPLSQSSESLNLTFLEDELYQRKSRRKANQKVRLLGEIDNPYPQESGKKMENLVPQTSLYLPDVGPKRGKKQKLQQLKDISKGLNFADDVAAVRCSHLKVYEEDELSRTVYERSTWHRSRQYKDNIQVKLNSFRKHEASQQIGENLNKLVHKPEAFVKIDKLMKQEFDEILCSGAKTNRQCRYANIKDEKAENNLQLSAEWDEYVLALLSKTTAKWLASEIAAGGQQTRLMNFLTKRYKESSKEKELVQDPQTKAQQDETRNDKFVEDFEKILTEINVDAHYSPSFTLPTAVGDKKLMSDNIFQLEMLAGAFPVRAKKTGMRNIVLDTNSNLKFEKKLQPNFPEDPQKWLNAEKHVKTTKPPGKVVKGLQRWNELPTLLQDDAYVPSFHTLDKPVKSLRETELISANKIRGNNSVVSISEEWRAKWLLEKRQNTSIDELIEGMNDINDHVRLAALAACSKTAEMRQHKKTARSFAPTLRVPEQSFADEKVGELEPELLACISKLLNDSCKQVRLTAAVTLCSLKVMEPKAVDILKESVQNGCDIERWLSAQSLASCGHCADYVIAELLSQTSSSDLVHQEKAFALLWRLSHNSSLVHAVVAELLNSSSCRDRLVACRLLPRLKGSLNKDVAQKISYIMWNDWEPTVRTAAAQALGRTGNGKLVHDALLKRLLNGDEREKVDSLRKLANLAIMTSHLLPAFLSCFESEFVSVRIEAATASEMIKTPDEGIIAALVKLASEDHSWKVKAHAIKALGAIGKITDDVTEMLVWNMRYCKIAAVRAEACNAVARLGLKDRRALNVLQDRMVVETDDVVRSEAERALKCLDVPITGNAEMLDTIRNEVKRLCCKDNIVSSILRREKRESYDKDVKRMIAADASQQLSCTQTSLAQRQVKSSASFQRGWDPILEGFRARSVLSEPATPMVMKMERSQLPMDLNSATSEGSQRSKSEAGSIHSDSSRSRSTTVEDFETALIDS